MEKKKKKNGLAKIFVVCAILAVLVISTFSTIKSHINLGLDLQGGFEILYQIDPLNEGQEVDMTAVVNSITKRVDVLGVSEPQITVEGDNRIRVQLAGVADQETAREMLGTTANLTFRDYDDNELSDASIIADGGASLGYQDGKPVVSLKIADGSKFGEITSTIAAKGTSSGQNIMVIWLDYEDGDSYVAERQKELAGQEPKYISAASVTSTISGDCIISGNFTESEARTLANLINSGSLPVKLTEISSNVVSAEFGKDALNKTAVAGIIGVLLVIAFMIFEYRVPGVLASIMLVAYLWAIFGIYALIGAVFTLPGIAALVLGVGMTVDANIITYERIRQELYKGHSVQSGIAQGQKSSFVTIFDAQFTTLLAGLVMYWWGNGSVKGFATMLIITVVMTLIVNVALSRFLLNLLAQTGLCDNKPEWFGVKRNQIPDVTKGEKQFYFGFKKVDFLSYSKKVIIAAIIVLVCALGSGVINSANHNGFMNLGIDFSSGTKLTISSETAITSEEVEEKLKSLGYDHFSYQESGDTTVYATTKDSLTTDQLTEIKTAFTEAYGIEPGDNVVTPVVGKELVRNAVILTLVAWVAMLLYIAFRYEIDYSLSCLVALVHDVLITLGVFAIFRFEVNTELISVLLTIIGYSINNSIVVCDRIKETLAYRKGKINKNEYTKIANEALNNTIRMTLYSFVTTVLPVIVLLIAGSQSIFTFTFAMFVGLIAGTISSMFIMPYVWTYIRTHYTPKAKKTKKVKKEALDEYTIKGINA